MSSFHERRSNILFAVSCISIIGLVLLILLTTSPIEDVVFFVEQIRIDSVFIDVLVIFFGITGFLYLFILPGLPFLVTSDGSWISRNPRDYIVVLMYTGLGNYAILLLGMVLGIPLIGLVGPLFLMLVALGVRLLFVDFRISPEHSDIPLLRLPENGRKKSKIALPLVVVVLLSLVVRFVLFNSNVVEYSDVIVYHLQTISIPSNDFLLNPSFTARAPLFTMFGYLFGFFTPTPLASLKTVSFMYSLLLFLPFTCIIGLLAKNRDSLFLYAACPIFFVIYPWTTMMGAVALQDILLTFYVMSFFALVLGDEQSETIAAAAAAGLAFLCRYSLGIIGPLGFLYLIYRDRKKGLRNSVTFLVVWSTIAGSWIFRNLVVAGVPFSTTDEGLFSLSNLIPGLSNVVKELGMDRHGMNTPILWLSIIVVILYSLQTEVGRRKIKTFFTLDYLFIYLTMVVQILVISLFFTQQYRFLLSIIWFFPILWLLLIDSFDIPGKYVLTVGWIVFSIAHILHITRIYWVFYLGRLPIGDFTGPTIVIESVMPSLANLGMFLVAWSLLIGFTTLLTAVVLPRLRKEIEQNNQGVEPRAIAN